MKFVKRQLKRKNSIIIEKIKPIIKDFNKETLAKFLTKRIIRNFKRLPKRSIRNFLFSDTKVIINQYYNKKLEQSDYFKIKNTELVSRNSSFEITSILFEELSNIITEDFSLFDLEFHIIFQVRT